VEGVTTITKMEGTVACRTNRPLRGLDDFQVPIELYCNPTSEPLSCLPSAQGMQTEGTWSRKF
jgi:hypothetical protein